METIVDYNLAEISPQKNYPLIINDHSLFCGYIIKNNYDEQRLSISRKLNPLRFTFPTKLKEYKLYGLIQPAPYNHVIISSLIKESYNNLKDYNILLSKNNLSCTTCFLHFSPELYPLDSKYISMFFPSINIESNFSNKKTIPGFQRVGNIYLFILMNKK